MPPAAVTLIRSSSPPRAFGHYALGRLLAKSELTMLWLATDNRTGAETLLSMPRLSPTGASSIGNWLLIARRAARLDHPNIAKVAECGVHEHWPFVAVDRRAGVPLDEWLGQHPPPSADDAAAWVAGVLRGLAFGHDAGIAHLDLQLHNILINERGQASVMALAVAPPVAPESPLAVPRGRDEAAARIEPAALRAQRAAAERDVLACGIVLHRLLAGAPALDASDVGAAIARMAPRGREFVRLPWTTPHPIAEALRAIVNRSTSAQLRLRYRNARTFLGALSGWLEATADDEGGPVALLLDRLRTVGHLPALPGLATRVQRITAIESKRTDEIARHLLPDMALSFELLRTYSSARVQGTQIPGNGPVLTLRRVVALIGVDGVREAANSLRTWPGPLDDDGARALRQTIDRVRLAGHVAQSLRPAGYDSEAVYLVAVLQSLGRLLLRYHFADEAEQIRQLTLPFLAPRGDGEPPAEQPGLDADAAAYAVLGVDIEAFGHAATRQWGLGDDVLHMIRRLPVDVPVRKPDTDDELLRIVASAANEAVDALELPPAKVSAALNDVVARYARTLRLTTRILHDALRDAQIALRSDGAETSAARADEAHGEAESVAEDAQGDAASSAAAAAEALLDREQHR
ncbi:MAG TPA: HDOD domain-containing protein [Caldimonas sp.]|nr:HDOD domain-containing protein [Caldimonas sp.]